MTSLDQSAQLPELEQTAPAAALFDPTRLRLVARCWMVIAAIAYVVDLLRQTRVDLTDGIHRPFGDDFINYWSGAYLALHGRAAEVYDFLAFHVFETSVVGPHIDPYHYSYPPILLLLSAPLALVPYVPALFVWLGATWYGFYRALKLTGRDGVLLLSLAAPALFVNAVGGQNGALTAALLGGGLMLVDRRPLIAGLMFGALAYKPQLAVMLPVALIAGRRWAAVAATAAAGLILVAASTALFGVERWFEYQHNLSILRVIILEDGAGVSHRMVSVFVFARHLGAGVGTAYALQAICALIAAFFVARAWFRDDPPHLRNAMVVVGTCLATPYLQDYDLVVGAFVVVWLQMAEADATIPARWTRAGMALMLLLPGAAAPLAKFSGYAVGPLFLVPLFGLLIVLSARTDRGAPPARLTPD